MKDIEKAFEILHCFIYVLVDQKIVVFIPAVELFPGIFEPCPYRILRLCSPAAEPSFELRKIRRADKDKFG